MYNGMDYSLKGPGDDEENAEANDAAREKGTGSGNEFDADKSPDPRYPHMLNYPESSAPEDCLYVVKWGGNPGGGKVDFEIRSKRKMGIVGFGSTKETVRESLVKEYFFPININCSLHDLSTPMKFSLQIGADVVVFNADGRVEDAHIDR